jgi:two-component system chemotaxis response regulator CheB
MLGTPPLPAAPKAPAFSASDVQRRSHGAKLLGGGGARVELPAVRGSMGAAARLVVIGASTGGPRVVQQILRDLPPTLPAAVLVVQHIADGFTQGMVDWLGSSCKAPVHLARGGELAQPGHVYVAPDNLHLLVDAHGLLSLSAQPALLQRPSVDVTMQRAAEAYGDRAIGVLLTGMGRDGAIGMSAIHRVGGTTIAQSGDTCVVYGMPRAAIEARVVDEVLGPELIAGRLQMLLYAGAVKEQR